MTALRMAAGQVLDMQADLALRMQDKRFRKVIEECYRLDFHFPGNQPGHVARQIEAAAVALSDTLHNHTRAAYAYRVTPDMTALVMHAAAQLDDTDAFHRDLAPTGCGIVRFDSPVLIGDVRGKTLKGHWLVWGPAFRNGTPATLCTWFNDAWDPDDANLERDDMGQMGAVLGRWWWVGSDLPMNGQALGGQTVPLDPAVVAEVEADGEVAVPASNPLRYVHALWLLLGQSIVTVSPEEPDRAAARRAKRANLPPRVSVIALRRSDSAHRHDDETLVEWSHRWLVRAYWRWQEYGPRKGVDHVHAYGPQEVENGHLVRRCVVGDCENLVRRIIVQAHTKGPEDKPLVISEKVYSLQR